MRQLPQEASSFCHQIQIVQPILQAVPCEQKHLFGVFVSTNPDLLKLFYAS